MVVNLKWDWQAYTTNTVRDISLFQTCLYGAPSMSIYRDFAEIVKNLLKTQVCYICTV